MEIFIWLLFGLAVGAIAKLLMPGDDPGGIVLTIVIGIIGSIVGGGMSYLFFGAREPYHTAGWILSIVGAVVLLVAYRVMAGHRTV
jgi:uncharacterized membrane protein YeaQ/YmgE (transglycosylase-associated protein family)